MLKKHCLIGLCLIGLTTNIFCASSHDLLGNGMKKKENPDKFLLVARTAFAIWGFTQNTTYGYVTGALLTIRIAFDLSGEK